MEYQAYTIHQRPVYPLTDSVLLWCIGHYRLPLNPDVFQPVFGLLIVIFSAVVGSKTFDLIFCLTFDPGDEVLKLGQSLSLLFKEVDPAGPNDIVRERQLVACSSSTGRGDGTANVRVD